MIHHAEHSGPQALREMQTLATRLFPNHSGRHVGDLAWAWTLADDATLPSAVWRDGDIVVAWAWFETPDELTIQVDPAHSSLSDDVLAWAQRSAPSPEPTTITISANEQPHLAPALATHGFSAHEDGPFFSCLSVDLLTTELPTVPDLPPGYVIRPVDDHDVATRAAVHREVWNSTVITAERHAAMRRTWPYKPEFDLIAVSPQGEAVAYCQGWYDELSGVGLFEPVGTRTDHRRLGLSRAIGITLLHAFAAAGARLATVSPRGDEAYPVPKLVYESIGFSEHSRTHTYTHTNTDTDSQQPA